MAGFVLLAVVATLLVVRLTGREVVRPPIATAPPVSAADVRASEAAELLADLTEALTGGSRAEALALAAPGQRSARRTLGWVYDNVQELGVTDLAMRFVAEVPGGVSVGDRRRLGPDAWTGEVALDWRLERYDEGLSSMEVPFTFVDTEQGAAFGAVAADSDRAAPLWLLTDLAVAQSRRALVAVADPRELDRFSGLAEQAVLDVRAVLPRWRGRLVVEVPASQDQLGRTLDAEPNAYDSIAALTATVDGSMRPGSPVHVLVNPDVFAELGEDGSQIVMSHEATHVAVGAATSTVPLWLLEGFADYVALARADLPVAVTASQILAEVRRNGPPAALPDRDDFDPGNKLLGTSYEAAWLACRLLAETHGEDRLIDFYDHVDRGASVADAFADLGTSEAEFTRRWRDYLRELAG